MKTTKFLICAAASLALGSAYSHPVVVDNWINETSSTLETTGTWTPAAPVFDGGWASLTTNTTFTANEPSTNIASTVTIRTTLKFMDECGGIPDEPAQAQAALKIYGGAFQVWAGAANPNWVPVEATGLTPDPEEEYEVAFTLDYSKGTYSVTVKGTDNTEYALSDGGTTEFAIAKNGAKRVQEVQFVGEGGEFKSLYGEYVYEVEDVVWPTDWNNGSAPSHAMQEKYTKWVEDGNSPSAPNAEAAFLLGVDVADYQEFAVTAITLAGDKVTIDTNQDLSKRNGVLYVLYAATPEAFNNNTATTVSFTVGTDPSELVNINAAADAMFFRVGIGYVEP